MILGAFAELVTIGAILPFLALLADPGRIADVPLVAPMLRTLGAHSIQDALIVLAALFGAAAVAAGIIRLVLSWSTQKFTFRVGHDVAVEIQRRILSQPYAYHIAHNTSEIVASLEKVQALVYFALLQVMLAVSAATISVFILAAIVYIGQFAAALAAVGFGLTYVGVTYLTRGRLGRNAKILNSAYPRRVQVIQESLGGIRDIILDGSQAVYLDSFREADLRYSSSRTYNEFIGTAPRFVIEAAGMVLIAGLAVLVTDQQGGIGRSLPVLGALALGAQRLLPLFQQVYAGWAAVTGSRVIMNDTIKLLSLPISHDHSEKLEPLPLREEIELQAVSFIYPNRAERALAGVSFTIRRGSRTALIGKTGSGKSTLVDLLMGLLEPSGGEIRVDGAPLIGPTRRRWQKSIAHVPQFIFLADSSIARNIAFGCPPDEIDMNRVIDAARRAQLNEFIVSLPQGYDTSVGERGVRLSGGQRQRLGIARALYKAAPVIILDEATSALDDATETAVVLALNELGEQGLTVIMIAHRLSTLASCDTVVRLSEGRVVEIGNYSQVIGQNLA